MDVYQRLIEVGNKSAKARDTTAISALSWSAQCFRF
jgi:hypothetical protein